MHTSLRFVLLIVGAVLLLPTSSAGGEEAGWTALGPYGGGIETLAIDPSDPKTIYAGMQNGGLYRSLDAGRSWQKVREGAVRAIWVDPKRPQHIRLAMYGGFYTSTDGGRTWKKKSEGMEKTGLQDLAVHRENADVLYAAGTKCLYRSEDGGENWSDVTPPELDGGSAHAIALSPESPDVLYTATSKRIFRTVDGGANWSSVSPQVAASPGADGWWDIVMHPARPQVLYAAHKNSGVFKTMDGGKTWTRLRQIAERDFRLLLVPTEPETVFLGTQRGLIYRSTDGGDTWESLAEGLPGSGIYALAYDRVNQVAYAGLFCHGFYRLEKGAEKWEQSNTGMTGHHVSVLIADPKTDTIFAGIMTYGGSIFKSGDHGKTWRISNSGMNYPPVSDLVMHPDDNSILYSGNFGSLFKSTDGGNSWNHAAEGLNEGYIHPICLALCPAEPDTLYFGADHRGQAVFKSTDGAASWEKTALSGTSINALAVDPMDAKTVYAGPYGSGVAKSADGGKSWEPANRGLPQKASASMLHVDPEKPTTVYLGLQSRGQGLFRSTAGGKDEWKRLTPEDLSVTVHVLLILDGRRLIIGTDKGVFVSKNHGETWAASSDLPPNTTTHALAYESSTNRIYAGGNKGIFSMPMP